MTTYVAVCGPADAGDSDQAAAEEIGRLLAERGAVVVSGGYTGVMEASCRGAKSMGGATLGILAGTDRRDANAYVDISVPTGMGEMRNMLVVRSADVVIAVAGEFGTLSEVAFALKVGVPVVGLRTWELAKAGKRIDAFELADDPADAVEKALSLSRGGGVGA